MSYLAIYRRFRPTKFSEVIGQEHVVTTLINQIKTDRIGHAYLFCGARGTGKTSVAKIFARAINCLTPENGSPCGHCETCKRLLEPTNLDILEIDAASNNKVDNVQEIRANVQYPPVAGRYKVYIIDEVHMLTTEAFNALLKTLEEPPKHAVFILATTEPHKLPATILSRCMRFDFHLVADMIIEGLIEKIYDEVGKTYEKEAVNLIAKSGEGSVRDALSLADLCLSYSNEKLTYKQVIEILGASDNTKTAKLLNGILTAQVGEVLTVVNELTALGKSISVLTKDVLLMVRDILVVKTCVSAKEILLLPDDEFNMLKNLADLADNHRFLRVLEIFAAIETDLRYSTHPKIVFEAAAVKAALPQEDYNIDALTARISALEKTVENLVKNGVTVNSENQQPRQIAPEKPSEPIQKEQEKPAYKPIIEEKSDNIVKESSIAKVAVTESAPEAPVEEKRIAAFDYISDDDAPPEEEPSMPVENQMSFDAMDLMYGSAISSPKSDSDKKKEEIDKAIEEHNINPEPATSTRERISDARLWGTVIRTLRAEKHIMLWIACQEADAEIKNNELTIIAEGTNEYNLLIKAESLETLGKIVKRFSPYTVKVVLKGVEPDPIEEFRKDAEEVVKKFDGKVKIEENKN